MVKWLFKLRHGAGLVSISPLKSSFREKKTKCENKYQTCTSLILLNLENRNILIVLHTKNPKLHDKKKIDIVVQMLQEIITTKAISISLR